MKRMGAAVVAGLALALAANSTLAGDPAAGKAKSVTCAACHGQDGISITPTYPNLACQKEDYLISSLNAYKSGARQNALMSPMAASLSDADIENLAAYYSELNCP